MIDDLAAGRIAVACCDAPRLLHVLGMDANNRRDLASNGGDFDLAQHARPTAFADPVRGEPRLSVLRSDLDVAAKSNGVIEAEALQESEQFDVAETPVGQDRDGDAVGQTR